MELTSDFSSLNRHKYIETINGKTFDLLIFGGGITGAGIALDAAARGLKVVLIEKNDFASGTSSRSTKLIHGGLRYFEKLQLKFVAQLGHERKVLHNNCAHNIIPTPVLLPIVKGGQLNKPFTYIALRIYDILAGVKKEYKARWTKKDKVLKQYPFLKNTGFLGAFKYNEYKTNDGRLVIEALKKANNLGAICLNYCTAIELLSDNGKVAGAKCIDFLFEREFFVKAKQIVNATGPWSEGFLNTYDAGMEKTLYPKGVHLVINKERFPINEAFYFDTHDNRMVFAIPRQDFVYVGTTDTPYSGNFDKPIVDELDMEYLLKVVNQQFSGLKLSSNDIVSCWAGIRPLIKGKGQRPGEISRKEELFESPSGLITITGGKLTGYRLMAKKVVDIVMKKLSVEFVKCTTHKIKLSGSDWDYAPAIHQLVELGDNKFDEAKQTGIHPTEFKKLFYRYGTNIDIIIEKAYEYSNELDNVEQVWIKTELYYVINFEMVVDIIGFCAYRTEMVLFETQKLKKHLTFIAECMAMFLGWNDQEKNNQIKRFLGAWNQYKIKKSK
ncbi:MAG: glycerol-3-phosphate dehydrogenase/oxidase [Salinivirgaceae bacterium]|jgi:glycerol-3-phosphate dehydrogenase|nr:glycerol-3-phosphate dehydrogenase/oxidase [Salinivirgaceae bacterium]